ncbi:MAG: class I SAM-dependent methyltransferase, partial [Gammaproteobacteria bacterium]|nr:class I SAM-dependent methyltransferase [Gammaproteobacteria bacterium]
MGRNAARKRKQEKGPKQAETADRYALYEDAVQDAPVEMEFVAETYAELRGREAKVLREDFCGSAWAACEWVKRDDTKRAIGVDLDHDVLEWGRERHWGALSPEQQARVQLIEGDVLATPTEKADITVAMNFSYWIFKQRDQLRRYFSAVKEGLAEDGMFIMDCYGGYEAFQDEYTEKRPCDGFSYVWEQEYYDPVTGDYRCHISFRFRDGSRLERAFSYEWRLWTLPEIRELLVEAGFEKVTVYWQGEDEDGEGDGIFEPVEHG